MIKYIFIIWFITPDNYEVVEEFATMKACQEKRAMYVQAFKQAKSELKTDCRVRWSEKK